MRIAPLLAVATAVAATLPSGTAHADASADVTAQFISTAYYRVGSDYVAAVACRAIALPADPQVTPITTQVTCSINGTARSEATAGPAAVSEVLVATQAPFQFCVEADASFLDSATNDVFLVTATPHCVTFSA